MKTPVARALISFNFLAMFLALAAAFRYVVNLPGSEAWWEFILTVAVIAFTLAIPFSFFLSRIFEGGGNKNRYFTIVVNLIFCVIGAFVFYDALTEQAFDAAELFAMGFFPVALANGVYLIFEKD